MQMKSEVWMHRMKAFVRKMKVIDEGVSLTGSGLWQPGPGTVAATEKPWSQRGGREGMA